MPSAEAELASAAACRRCSHRVEVHEIVKNHLDVGGAKSRRAVVVLAKAAIREPD